MIVAPAVDVNLETYQNDPGALLNIGTSAAILSMPSMRQLHAYWQKFQEELRTELHHLFSWPHDEVVQRFGLLGYNARTVGERGSNLWGLAPRIFAEAKGLARVHQPAVLKAIVDAGLLTRDECGHSKFRRREGTAVFLNGLPAADQRRFFDALLTPECNLEEVIRFQQGCGLGLACVEAELHAASGPEDFLIRLGCVAIANAELPVAPVPGRPPRWYAPIWFSAYLVREGAWLLPPDYARHAGSAYPEWMKPVQLWLSMPTDKRDLCDALMRDHMACKGLKRQADPLVVRVALELAWTSNIWSADSLCAGPLIGYKKNCLTSKGESSSQRSWAANRLWEAQQDYFGASANAHPDAHAFVLGKRLVSKGTKAFNWVHNPNERNLDRYDRLYGTRPTHFPAWLRDWANELEGLLRLFDVEAIDAKIAPLDYWLLYLAGLSDPPRSFEEISRREHVNSGGSPSAYSFRDFLVQHFAPSNTHAQRAMATLRQAWALSSVQRGFASRLANPFDHDDSPFASEPRRVRTVRTAMDSRVAEIIARENMRNDMAFARALGDQRQCWRTVRSPETGDLINVFFPAAPILVHIILHSGMRGKQAVWLDSGEGDENAIDFETLATVPNPNKAAERGRQQGFLRVCEVMADQRTQVLGMFVNSGKSGPHEVPWVHDDVIGPVRILQDFQRNYYPISSPLEMTGADFHAAYKKKKGESFPLARDPVNRIGHPLSKARLRNYWLSLLEYCQEQVDRELGYRYPLTTVDGLTRFDIHSLRVTIVTTLLENGVPPNIVQKLVGHGSLVMTWYYHDVTNHKVHSALQLAFERLKAGLRNPESLSNDDEMTLTTEIVTFRTEEDFVGAEMLAEHREAAAGLDVFAHGICPGGDCETGGERIMEGRYKPVWRPRACSGCRYRVTGPAFLNGLVHRANSLMWEIKGSMRKEAELNSLIEEEEDAGRSVGHLRSTVAKEQDLRDHLVNEWCLEIRTINQAQELLKSRDLKSENSLVTGHDLQQVSARWKETHEFELAQRLVSDSRIVQDTLELPADVTLYRDQILHKIAYANGISQFFYSIDESASRRALGQFGELLVAHTAPTGQLQAVIEGSLLLADLPQLSEALMDTLKGAESIQIPPPADAA